MSPYLFPLFFKGSPFTVPFFSFSSSLYPFLGTPSIKTPTKPTQHTNFLSRVGPSLGTFYPLCHAKLSPTPPFLGTPSSVLHTNKPLVYFRPYGFRPLSISSETHSSSSFSFFSSFQIFYFLGPLSSFFLCFELPLLSVFL